MAFVDDSGWVRDGSNIDRVVTILGRCAAQSIEWANRPEHQCNTPRTEPALCTPSLGHKEHLWEKLPARIEDGNWFKLFN